MLGVDPLVISWSATNKVVEEKKEEKMQQMKCLVLSLALALLIVGLLHLQLQNEVALLKANQVNLTTRIYVLGGMSNMRYQLGHQCA